MDSSILSSKFCSHFWAAGNRVILQIWREPQKLQTLKQRVIKVVSRQGSEQRRTKRKEKQSLRLFLSMQSFGAILHLTCNEFPQSRQVGSAAVERARFPPRPRAAPSVGRRTPTQVKRRVAVHARTKRQSPALSLPIPLSNVVFAVLT